LESTPAAVDHAVDLGNEEWAVLKPLMPRSRKSSRADDRKEINAIFYVLRTGILWRDSPERHGLPRTAYTASTVGHDVGYGRRFSEEAKRPLRALE
jgi:transposase